MRDVCITVFESSDANCGIPELLKDVPEFLNRILGEVPPEYRDSVSFIVGDDGDYDCPRPFVEISYTRPQTEDEYRWEKQEEAIRRKSHDDHERALYEQLKLKFKDE